MYMCRPRKFRNEVEDKNLTRIPTHSARIIGLETTLFLLVFLLLGKNKSELRHLVHSYSRIKCGFQPPLDPNDSRNECDENACCSSDTIDVYCDNSQPGSGKQIFDCWLPFIDSSTYGLLEPKRAV